MSTHSRLVRTLAWMSLVPWFVACGDDGSSARDSPSGGTPGSGASGNPTGGAGTIGGSGATGGDTGGAGASLATTGGAGGTGGTGGWGAVAGATTGGVAATGGLPTTGGVDPTGGSPLGGGPTGGVAATGGLTGTGGAPVDCSGIASAGWELCGSGPDFCAAVFEDGAGCETVCAAAGLGCAEVWENMEGSCAPDTTLPALTCSPGSGHQSDYCLCTDDGSGGTGGTPSTGGAPATGGAPPTGGTSGSGGTTGNAPCEVPDYIFSDPSPIGWADQNGGTTGGGNASPVLVTSLSELQGLTEDSTPQVVYVQGTLDHGVLDIGSNKTIIGCSSGAHVRGRVAIGSGSSNIVMRNLNISGYAVGDCSLDPSYDASEGCSSGNDAVSVNGNAHHVWFDHCAIQDGTDGNLDITNDADFVTVSWTKFSYAPRSDNQGSDSTGGAGHRYSNLVGGTDTPPTGWPGTIPLNVTWHHNWWADNVVERMPRVRFGRNHIYNNYYSSRTSNYCVRAGIEAAILLEANYFDGVSDPHEFNNSSNEQTAYIAIGSGDRGNVYSGTSGVQSTGGGGEPWTSPPYQYSLDAAGDVPNIVASGAGPH